MRRSSATDRIRERTSACCRSFTRSSTTSCRSRESPSSTSTAAPASSGSNAKEADGETEAQAARIDEFLGGLDIRPVRDSRIVEVLYDSTDPSFAAQAANAVAQAYIDDNMESRFSASKSATDWLSDRLAEQRRALEASEAALQAYREKNGTVSVTDSASNIVVQRLTELNAALTKAKTDRIDKEAQYNQLKAAQAAGTLDTYPAVQSSDYIQKLKVRSRGSATPAGHPVPALRRSQSRDDPDARAPSRAPKPSSRAS